MSTPTLYQKLARAVDEMKDPSKNSVNSHFKNRYAGLEETVDVVKEGLKDAGLSMVTLFEGRVMVLRVFDTETGEFVDSRLEIPFDDLTGNTFQQIGSGITYYRRYLLQAFFSLVAEDDDAQGAPSRPAAQRKPQATAVTSNGSSDVL